MGRKLNAHNAGALYGKGTECTYFTMLVHCWRKTQCWHTIYGNRMHIMLVHCRGKAPNAHNVSAPYGKDTECTELA